MVSASKKVSTTQPKLPVEDKKVKPSLAIGATEAAYELAMTRLIKFVTGLVAFISVVIEHATPQRKAAVLARVKEMVNVLVIGLDPAIGAVQTLADVVKAEENSNLEGVRPKFIRKVVEALTGLGLDIDTASEFIVRKQEGTPFEGDGDVHDAILLEMGFTLSHPVEDAINAALDEG